MGDSSILRQTLEILGVDYTEDDALQRKKRAENHRRKLESRLQQEKFKQDLAAETTRKLEDDALWYARNNQREGVVRIAREILTKNNDIRASERQTRSLQKLKDDISTGLNRMERAKHAQENAAIINDISTDLQNMDIQGIARQYRQSAIASKDASRAMDEMMNSLDKDFDDTDSTFGKESSSSSASAELNAIVDRIMAKSAPPPQKEKEKEKEEDDEEEEDEKMKVKEKEKEKKIVKKEPKKILLKEGGEKGVETVKIARKPLILPDPSND